MRKPLPVQLILLLCIAIPIIAQENVAKKYPFRGVIRDSGSSAIVGLPLKINGEYASLTDLEGEFYIPLPNGDYILTTDALPSDKFRAFIKISDDGLNPNYLEFVIDSSVLTCFGNNSNSLPKIISSEHPLYPAAAKAIRAFGQVVVDLKVAQNGSVLSAKAVSGHPLLRAASVVAAQNSKFEPSEIAAERETQLVFVFLRGPAEKQRLKRYECPYRIMVVSEVPTNEH